MVAAAALILTLFACQRDYDNGAGPERAGETLSATLGVGAGSLSLASGARVTFSAGFFSQNAEVTLTSSGAAEPSVTLTLPAQALSQASADERKTLSIYLPEPSYLPVCTADNVLTEVYVRLADGTEEVYLEPRGDAQESQREPRLSADRTVTLDLSQFRNAAVGTLEVRVRHLTPTDGAPDDAPNVQPLLSQALPSGFVLEDVVTDLDQGITFDFAPDGRIFIGEKRGAVRVFDNELRSEPFIDLSCRVNSRHDRGLLGLVVHPDFPAQPYVYLLFTYDPPELSGSGAGGRDGKGARVSRLVRVTADKSRGYNVALPGSEKVLLGTNSTNANIGDPNAPGGPPSCKEAGGYVRDCLPADEQSHTIGTVRFAPDGSLFVGNGDGANYMKVEPYAARALDPDSLAGKIMRIDPLTGEGYADNPFYDGDPNSNRAKVYSLGLRNPFRFALQPETGEPFIGDVGWTGWEEVNTGRGANFGWPCYEGADGLSKQQGGYRTTQACQDFYSEVRQGTHSVTSPLYSYTRRGVSSSVQVGDFYTGTRYPDRYRGALFITDYNQRWIRTLTLGADGGVASVDDFGSEPGVVQLSAGPGGDLYLMNIQEGKLKRLRYTGAGNTPPEAKASATGASGALPLTVRFQGDGSTDPDGDPLSYHWSFGDGATSTEANPVHTYQEVNLYRARLTVSDSAGATSSTTLLVEAGTLRPVATILAPKDGATYTIGDHVPFRAANQKALPDDAFSWTLKLNHNEHQHFDELPPTTGVDGVFKVPDHGDNTSLELCLVVRAGSESAPSCVTLRLNTVEYTLHTEPSGLKLSWEGMERTTPFTVETNVNARQQLTALAEQNGLEFQAWSDGGARVHDITVMSAPQTLVARYASPKGSAP